MGEILGEKMCHNKNYDISYRTRNNPQFSTPSKTNIIERPKKFYIQEIPNEKII
jgi:hypothetical protein